MTLATSKPPVRHMTEGEAREITEAIRNNFDSLGKMLVQVQERKGFLALGYKTLESYCATEFGKGRSRVYQMIEEAKIEEEILGELTSEDSPIKSLKMPGTHLRMLSILPSSRDKVNAIKYANTLAEQEGRKKATKLHLQIAALKFSGQKSEHLRKSLEDLGFNKGVEIEIVKGYDKNQRGFIRKIDKKGQIYVELHAGTNVPVPLEADRIKVISDTEKPQTVVTAYTTSIGDTVKIYSSNSLKGKIGKIFNRLNEKQAIIKVDELLVEIPYAELEPINQQDDSDLDLSGWDKSSIWGDNYHWSYNKNTTEIRSFIPEICFQPSEPGTPLNQFSSPADWLENWSKKYGVAFAADLLDADKIATLVMTVAINMTYDEKRDFIRRINQLLTKEDAYHQDDATASALEIENGGQIINISHPQKGDFGRYNQEIFEYDCLTWAKNAINNAEDFCPGQLDLFATSTEITKISPEPENEPNQNWQKDWLDKNFPVRPDPLYSSTQGVLLNAIEEKTHTLFDKIEAINKSLKSKTLTKKDRRIKEEQIKSTRRSIEYLETFKNSNFQIGMLVSHQREAGKIGVTTNLTLSGLIPNVWVKWEESNSEVPESFHLLNIENETGEL